MDSTGRARRRGCRAAGGLRSAYVVLLVAAGLHGPDRPAVEEVEALVEQAAELRPQLQAVSGEAARPRVLGRLPGARPDGDGRADDLALRGPEVPVASEAAR